MQQITNEEMEALNRASEILSKYANRGKLTQDDLDYFERLVVAIIDGDDDQADSSSAIENQSDKSDASSNPVLYPTTKYRIDESLYSRDLRAEKEYGIDKISLYGYFEDTDSLYILGQISSKKPKKPFAMICTIYDKDGDIIETEECSSYGSGLVTSMIKPEAFFDGFPFKFRFWGVSQKKIKKISISPADSY